MEHLVIDWSHLKFYNTIMAVSSGAALASISMVLTSLVQGTKITPRGWGINFLALGIILLGTGMHMTLTWPLAPMYAFDNISFGEPVFVLGAITFMLGFYYWKQTDNLLRSDQALKIVAGDILNFKFILYGIGYGLVGIGLAGLVFGLFTAPIEEPVVGLEALLPYPLNYLSTVFVSMIWASIGVCAIYTPALLNYYAYPDSTSAKNSFWVIKF
ncbi:MAG: DUF981 family protein [Saprospiraceae bacterium]|nr:DUF981 family protein [Saprospiraceae bacterium]